MDLITKLEKQNKRFFLTAGVLLTIVVGIADFLTGYELAFSIFYVLPISLVTWLTTQRLGLLVSLASATVLLVADQAAGHPYSHPLIPLWNTLIRFATFVIIALLVSALKNAWLREREQARSDYMTGAVNTRFFYELLKMEIDRMERYQRPFTIAYIDLDNFKSVNDKLGHATGDRVLHTLAESVRMVSRKTDIFARIGGDEFALLLPETSQEQAQIILPKVKAHLVREMRKHNWPVTFSIGVLTCLTATHSADEIMQRADELMYKAKRDHKNKTKYATLEAG